MPKADGSVVIQTSMDVTNAQKDLDKLQKNIEKTEDKLRQATQNRDTARKQEIIQGAELDEEKRKLEELRIKLQEVRDAARGKTGSPTAKAELPIVQRQVQEQAERVRQLQTEYNRTASSAEKYDAQVTQATQELTRQRQEAGALVQQLNQANDPLARLNRRFNESGGFLEQFSRRVKGLMKRVFVFTVITMALRGLRTWLTNLVKGNDEAREAMARLKGAMLTLAQPLIEILIPAFTALVNILTVIVSRIAAVVSALFGKTAAQSAQAAKELNAEKDALGGVGSAAEEAAGSLAGFDEINTIQTEDKTGGGGGGGGSSEMLPDFSGADAISEKLKKIADLVILIGAGFAMWKIGKAISGPLGTILQKLGLVLMLVGGLILFAHGFNDAWNNGVDWTNLIEMVGGLSIAVFSLYMLFGPVAAGVALVIGGIAMLVLAFKDAMENGWNLKNTLLAIAAILGTGLGFFFITGSVIPLVIAGIASVLLALTILTGHGEELIEGIKEFLQGFVDFFVGIFTGDIDRAVKGIEEIFNGLWQAVEAIWNSLRDVILGFFDWLNEITGGKIAGTLNALKQIFATAFAFISETISGLWNSLKTVLSGIINFIGGVFSGDWSRAWNGIKQIFSGIWSAIVTIAKGGFNLIIVAIETFVNGLIAAFNLVLSGINWIGSLFGASINLQIQPLQIPRLAQGAVIPPNREFMAVLGDQKSGTNIEAPEDLIRKIVREETAGTKNSRPAEIKIYLDRKLLGSVLIDEINDRTIQAGRSVLKI